MATDPFSSFDDAPFELLLSRVHPQYRIVGAVGQGATSTVFRAHHEHLRRDVAIKAINVQKISQHDSVERFLRETEAIGAVNHDNVIYAHDAGQIGPWCYIIMDYVKGISLSQAIHDRGKFQCNEACEIAKQIVCGLQSLETNGLVHRDIKPSNVMITFDGTVKIVDMGLSSMTGSAMLTKTGVVLGTPDYTAPEQVDDPRNVDIRADIYSLGCVIYEMVCGRPILDKEKFASTDDKFLAHVGGAALQRLADDDSVPDELRALLESMLAANANERCSDLNYLLNVLDSLAVGADTRNFAPIEKPEPQVFLKRKWRWIAAAICIGFVGVLMAVALTPNLPAVVTIDVLTSQETSSGDLGLEDEGNRLRVRTGHVCLLSLDGIKLDSCTLSLTIKSLANQGRLGFFWGYEPGGNPPSYQRLVLDPQSRLARDVYQLNKNGGSDVLVVADNDFSIPGSTSYRFTLTIEAGRVIALRINDVDYPHVIPVLQRDPAMFGDGRWGILVRSSFATVSELTVNGVPHHFDLDDN